METITLTAMQMFIIRTAVGKSHAGNIEDGEQAAALWRWLAFGDEEKERISYQQTMDGEEHFTFDVPLARAWGGRQRRLALKILEMQVGLFRIEAWENVKGALLALGWEAPIAEEQS